MINLVNGRGQIGSALADRIDEIKIDKEVFIYHTWNVWQKDFSSQKIEYQKFKKFVDKNKNSGRIIFISTASEGENYYVFYKQKSEAYLILNCEDCVIIRLPNLIGNKGIFSRLKNKEARPYGEMEVLSMQSAAQKIIEMASYDGLVKSHTCRGEKISASTLNSIINISWNKER